MFLTFLYSEIIDPPILEFSKTKYYKKDIFRLTYIRGHVFESKKNLWALLPPNHSNESCYAHIFLV